MSTAPALTIPRLGPDSAGMLMKECLTALFHGLTLQSRAFAAVIDLKLRVVGLEITQSREGAKTRKEKRACKSELAD
jgi:hypothetical protein